MKLFDYAWKGFTNIVVILWFFLNMVTLVTFTILIIAFAIDPTWLTKALEVTCQK